MKNKKFGLQIREAAKVNKSIWLPPGQRTYRSWPLCLTCRKEVEAVELKNVNSVSAEIWARCHGAEDYYRVDFPCHIEGDVFGDDRANWAIKRAMHDFCPFNPCHEDKGFIIVGK